MSSRDEALVTPSVMQWARESAGYDIQAASLKIKRPVSDIEGWEDGSLRPSMAQARKAAEVYRRSLAVFYLDEPPKDFDTLRDFRRMPIDRDPHPSPALSFVIRQTHNRQEWMRDTLNEQGAAKLTFVGSATTETASEQLAADIRQWLGVSIRKQARCRSRTDALNMWIEHTEMKGVYVCRESHVGREHIECEEARGFALTDEYAPFIFINSSDAKVAQIFTLLHELAHIWIGQPGISNLQPRGVVMDPGSQEIEKYCNEVASLTLMPPDTFEDLWSGTSDDDELEERIEYVSKELKISEEVVARRLLEERMISRSQYRELREFYAERWHEYRDEQRKKLKGAKGGPSPHLMRTLSNGRAFTHIVLSSYYAGRVSGTYASSLLSAKVNHFPKLAEHASITFGSARQRGGA